MVTRKIVANKDSRERVASQLPFKGSNLEGKELANCYVVLSYKWYPLFVYCKSTGIWYENKERYSVSTSKQRGQCHPLVETIKISLQELQQKFGV